MAIASAIADHRIARRIAAEMAPEMMQVDTSYYDKGELNAEALLNLNVDVVFYNAFNKEHGEMFRKAGIPAVGFTTLGNPSATTRASCPSPPPRRCRCCWASGWCRTPRRPGNSPHRRSRWFSGTS